MKQRIATTGTGTGTNLGFEEEISSNFESYLRQHEVSNNTQNLTVGTRVKGTIYSKNSKYTMIDINNKSNVIIDNNNLENLILENINIGEEIELLITEISDKKEYTIFGSVHQLRMLEVQDFLEQAYEQKTVITGVPVDLNHAGYTVSVNINDQIISLFMPHLLTDVNKLPQPESILNSEIDFLLDVVNKNGIKSFIASRKAYLHSMVNNEIKKLIKGNIYVGFVTGTTEFAVFVQFNDCLTGMIHKSNLTEEAQIKLLDGTISNGTNIEFYVKDIIKGKLFLTQTLKESLWDSISEKQELVGTVCAVKDFGLLVSLDYETKGLLHSSVLNNKTYNVGDSINVIVSSINKNKRQITLSLK